MLGSWLLRFELWIWNVQKITNEIRIKSFGLKEHNFLKSQPCMEIFCKTDHYQRTENMGSGAWKVFFCVLFTCSCWQVRTLDSIPWRLNWSWCACTYVSVLHKKSRGRSVYCPFTFEILKKVCTWVTVQYLRLDSFWAIHQSFFLHTPFSKYLFLVLCCKCIRTRIHFLRTSIFSATQHAGSRSISAHNYTH